MRRRPDVPWNDAVEGASEKMQRLARGTNAALTGYERAKVLSSLRDDIGPEGHLNAPKRSAIGGHLRATGDGQQANHRESLAQYTIASNNERTSKKTTAERRRRARG